MVFKISLVRVFELLGLLFLEEVQAEVCYPGA